MQKPFLPIEEQIKLLESRGVVIDLNESPSLLLRYGYYSIINGYKDPFIDRQRSSELSNDFYKEGTKFSDIYRLFEFDLFLREILLKYLLRVEQMFKTVCTYTFAEFHMGNTYLNKESYCTEEQYSSIGLFNYETSLNKLIKKLKKIIQNNGYNTLIEVDGGIKAENIQLLKDAGADICVAGSAVFGKPDRKKAIDILKI